MTEAGAGAVWLAAASLFLSVLLGICMLGYRRLYLDALSEQRESEELIEHLFEGIYRSSLDGRMLKANSSLARLNGYPSREALLAGVNDIATEWYVEPSRRAEFRALLDRDGKVEDFVSEVHRHHTRERIWVSEAARIVRDRHGRPLYYEGSVREVTETVQRLKLEEQFRKLTRQLPGALFQTLRQPHGRFENIYVSIGWMGLLGFTAEEHLRDPYLFVRHIHRADRRRFIAGMQDSGDRMQPLDLEFRVVTRTGEEKWLRMTAKPEEAPEGVVWHGYITDISQRKRAQMEIEELAFFDPLTHLPNRRLLVDRMTQALAGSARRGSRGALLFIDLDNFKSLNDTQGHDVGDRFLVQVSERLKASVRNSDTVARIGGDEFVVIAEELGADEAGATQRAITIAGQLLAALRHSFDLGGLQHAASASVGVVLFDGTDAQVDELLKRADIAMYQAKAAGRNGVALFDPVSMERESERYRLVADLRAAIAADRIDLHFQPQIDRAGAIRGAEALLRWKHPEHGLMLPERFLPLAEQHGLSHDLGKLAVSRGLAQLAAWQAEPQTASLRLSINVSAPFLRAPDFIGFLDQQIAAHGADPGRLSIELTEHVMARDQRLIGRRMRELKKRGVRLALDDFGTGYSSLAHLKRLPFDEVKIDGGFVAEIERDDGDRALIRMILMMARTLGLTTVAEHVETAAQEAILRSFGCDVFQGFLFSEALPTEQFRQFLASGGQRPPDTERLTA